MGLPATFVLYLVIGVGVESALLSGRDPQPVARWFSVLTGILFWPLYVPVLLDSCDEDSIGVGHQSDSIPSGESTDQLKPQNSEGC